MRHPTFRSLAPPYRDGTTHVIFEPMDFIARARRAGAEAARTPDPVSWCVCTGERAAGDCEHRGASGHRADPRTPRPGPAVARSGASEPGAATSSPADPIQRDTREAGASPGGFGLAPRRAPVASAFLATPGRFAGTIERRWLATIAQDQMRTELRPHRPSQPLQYACHRAFKITILHSGRPTASSAPTRP